MNSYNKTYLDQISQEKGFVRDNLEKVIRLAEILRYINQSPLLQKSLVLKVLPIEERAISIDFLGEIKVRVLSPIELFASKINALINRAAVRDIYDVYGMIKANLFSMIEQTNLLRKTLVFYMAVGSSCKAEEVTLNIQGLEHIKRLSYAQVRTHLMPVLSRKEKFDFNTIKSEVMSFLDEFLVFSENEYKFIEHFNRREYRPDILFGEGEISKRIASHPMALWKCRPKEQ